MRDSVLPTLILATVFYSPLSHADRTWNSDNDPSIMSGRYVYQYSKLPLAGSADLTKRGWSDTYWPLENGMISHRWQVPDDDFKKDKSPTASQVLSMTEEQINLLSPVEKYDLARSDLNFTLTKDIRKDYSGNERSWRGICNGWTQASLNFDEPKPFVYTSTKLNIRIPFGSSDMKALLAYYYAHVDDSPTVMVGKRCRLASSLGWMSGGCKDDINAGSFHVIMSNELGINHHGFAADRDPANQVWNQPFIKFEAHQVSVLDKYKGDKLSRNASKSAVKEITISADVYYADEIDPTYLPVIGTTDPTTGKPLNSITKVEYNYVIELDVYGNVIGGEWLDENRPDFVWKQTFYKPTGEHKMIETLYEQSQAPQ